MSFWDKLSDALPSKSIARGRELQMSEITGIHLVPDSVVCGSPTAFQCQICKVTPKAAFANNTKIYDVCLSDDASISIPFADSIARIIQACEGCVHTFNLIAAHKQYVAEMQIIENERERERIESQAQWLNRDKEDLEVQKRAARQKKIEEEQREFARMKKEYEAKHESMQKSKSTVKDHTENNSQLIILYSNCGVKNSIDRDDTRPTISCAVCRGSIHLETERPKPGEKRRAPSSSAFDETWASAKKTMFSEEAISVKCSECKSLNTVSTEKIKKKHIFAPVCSICRAKLIF